MKKATFVILLIPACLFTSNIFAATYSGGAGTAEDPYVIANKTDLLALAADTPNYDKYFVLTADIDLEGQIFATAIIAPDTDNTDAGFQGTAFTGVFDGNGHKIINFTIYCGGQDYLGLFGRIGLGGQVKSIGLENCSVSGFDKYYIAQYIGSLAGENAGDINGCYSSGYVYGSYCVGGLVGYNKNRIDSCYSISDVNGFQEVGGLVGGNAGSLRNCYAAGAVNGSSDVGGLVGYNSDIVRNCYSIGIVTGDDYDSSSLGGMVGTQSGSTINSFWDVQSSGLGYSAGGKGKTTYKMKEAACYLGWNSSTQIVWTLDEGNDYPRLIWENKPGQSLPAQSFDNCVPGSGTISDPYRISTAGQFNLIGLFPELWDKAFCLERNIDLAGITGDDYNQISVDDNYPFSGIFDGCGFIISNFTYTTASGGCIGLFGYTSNATLENMGIENVVISSNGYIGGLVGRADRTKIQNCYSANLKIFSSTGSVVGGLVGVQYFGSIIDCHGASLAASSSLGGSTVGGLVGCQLSGAIIRCHVTGSIASSSSSSSFCSSYAGGLVGQLSAGTITNCYSTGSVTSSRYGNGEGSEDYYSVSVIVDTVDFTSRSYAGGLVGCQYSGTINSCYNMSSITSSAYFYSSSPYYYHSSRSSSGGVVGYQYAGTIISCYNIGSVASYPNASDESYGACSYAGGLAGYQDNNSQATIERCYSAGSISTTENYRGGLLGYKYGSNGTIAACFWDTETSGLDDSAGGSGVQGKTAVEMQMLSTFTAAGWDFTNETANGINDPWRMCVEGAYPRLTWEFTDHGDFACPDGVGTEDLDVLAGCWLEIVRVQSDVNDDGTVNLSDFMILSQEWQASDCSSCDGIDITGDGKIDELDLAIMAQQWLFQENIHCQMTDLNTDGGVNLADWAIFAEHWLETSVQEGTAEVPDVKGITQTDARTAIMAAGFRVGIISYVSNDEIEAGCVVNQRPAAGINIPYGTAVDIQISLGSSVMVPNVAGMTRADAEAAINAVGLALGTITYTYSGTAVEEYVASQNPSAGTIVSYDTCVDIEINTDLLIVVPDVVGMTQEDAKAEIIAAGLMVGPWFESYSDIVAEGYVINQYPAAGIKIYYDVTEITLEISLGPEVVE